MSGSHPNNFPKLHNAMWPGLVGKGSPGAEPTIDLDTMLDLTAAAEVDGIKFDGVDLFLYDPHINIDISDDDLKAMADKIAAKGFVVGSVVAPVWFDASAMGDERQRENYLTAIRKACRIAKELRELGVRPYGVVRIDSASSPADWAKDPEGNQKKIAETFKQAAAIARDHGERLAAEGEICWGGMHSWRHDGRPARTGRRAGDGRLPGRHGAHAALHARRERTRGSHPPQGLRLEGPRRPSTPP